ESDGPGRGALFTVSLPIGGVTPAEEPAPAPLRVLVVGPDDGEREMVRTTLEADGARVTAVEAEAAPAQVADADVVIVGGPAPDPIIDAIRRRPKEEGGWVPAIAITDGGDARGRMAAGFQLHVPRPIEPDRLLAAVARAADWRPADPSG